MSTLSKRVQFASPLRANGRQRKSGPTGGSGQEAAAASKETSRKGKSDDMVNVVG